MVDITTLFVRTVTATKPGSGTDGDVFVGICGREFFIDSEKDDFERGQDRTLLLGEKPALLPTNIDIVPVRNDWLNDPRNLYKLKTENLYKYPVYVRFEPEDRDDLWVLEYVSVFVNPTSGVEPFFNYEALGDRGDFLALGQVMGKYCYLHRTSPPVPASLPDGTRGL
jgi:hypothetical protein